MRQQAKANAELAKSNANLVKACNRSVKDLNRQVRREQYLAKKSARTAEFAASLTQDTIARLQAISNLKQQRINDLERLFKSTNKSLDLEKKKNKNLVLVDHKHDVRLLQKKQLKLQCSAEKWQTK